MNAAAPRVAATTSIGQKRDVRAVERDRWPRARTMATCSALLRAKTNNPEMLPRRRIIHGLMDWVAVRTEVVSRSLSRTKELICVQLFQSSRVFKALKRSQTSDRTCTGRKSFGSYLPDAQRHRSAAFGDAPDGRRS